MKRLELLAPPPLVLGACGLLMWLVASAVPAADFDLPASGFLAVVIAVLAAAMVGGVFRLSRNPIYLADLGLLLAWGLWLANVAAFVLLPLFVAYLNRFQIEPEERALEARFGAAFAEYRGCVRRWL